MAHEHLHEAPAENRSAPPGLPEDAGSKALSEALRSSFFIVKILMVILVLVFIASGVFTVEPGQKAVILRFGKPVGEGEAVLRGEGIHWAWPYPIDDVEIIPLTQSQVVSSSIGWWFQTAAQKAAGADPEPGTTLRPGTDGYTVTGDGNILHVKADLRYRIQDPLKYIFNFTSGESLVQSALNNALVYASARYPIDDVLSRDQTGFRELVENRVRRLAQEQNIGILVERVDVEARPPRQLAEKFEAVNQAEQRRGQTINEAEREATEIRSKALSRAAYIKAEARAEAARNLQVLRAEAQRFEDLLSQYEQSPRLFATRLQLESLQEVLNRAQDKVYLPSGTKELRILLNREPPRLNNPAAQPEKPKDDH